MLSYEVEGDEFINIRIKISNDLFSYEICPEETEEFADWLRSGETTFNPTNRDGELCICYEDGLFEVSLSSLGESKGGNEFSVKILPNEWTDMVSRLLADYDRLNTN